ncbi:MAG TPA: chorismate synthase [Clostridiales bacterium]|nr:chorismate synthase [Clostridiales bacterium]
MRYLSAGESHGPCLTAIVEGMPSNVKIDIDYINHQLKRRQGGYGRGGRMKIERDKVKVLSGLRSGKTTGAPITLVIENKDWENWAPYMDAVKRPVDDSKKVTAPRPGHADLTGVLKYHLDDVRNVLERSSARETALRVAVGALARQLLTVFGISILSHVVSIGNVSLDDSQYTLEDVARADDSPVRCICPDTERKMMAAIDRARQEGDSLGGCFEVIAKGVPIGLGSHVHWDRKLDARIAAGLMSIQAIKGVEFGRGFETTRHPGSKVHDEIYYSPDKGYYRSTNNAGGIEGGMSNGQPIIARAAMKPIPTLYRPLNTVDIVTKQPTPAGIERSDTCAVPAASVVGEGVMAWILAGELCIKFGGDSLDEMLNNYNMYNKMISSR